MNKISENPHVNLRYIQIGPDNFIENNPAAKNKIFEKDNSKINKTNKVKRENLISAKKNSVGTNPLHTFYNFSKMPLDTTGLDQIYHERTLNVTLKYPNGWTYIDQDVKHKLDGVTFWFEQTNIMPPPYVHLEVEDKDLFEPSRFKSTTEINGNKIYFNDPEELEGQITQTLYIRTSSDEDYSIKLIIEGKTYFNSFLPIFWGMVKSFKFGNGLF
ncbi:MAG: hypothetical protein ACYDA4_01360 [Ignavibacteriaceae bacterium]